MGRFYGNSTAYFVFKQNENLVPIRPSDDYCICLQDYHLHVYDNMGTLSALLALFKRTLPVTGGFASQHSHDVIIKKYVAGFS